MNSPGDLPTALRAHAQGLYCMEAAAELIIAQQSRLRRTDFTNPFVTVTRGLIDGQTMALVNWAAAIAALDAGELPCSGGEQRMLRITASLDEGIPVNLRDTLTGLDDHNVQLMVRAVLHTTGQRPAPQIP